MSTAKYLIGDVFDRMADLPDGSVDLVLTSPPFLALRSYLPADHPDKGKEIGSEPNPAAFIDALLALTAEWDRLLAPHGSICIELGDTYSGSGGAGGDYAKEGLRDGQPAFTGSGRRSGGWPLDKSLALIPELYRIGLAYGINPLTGRESPAGRWRVRNVVRWHRPNPPVGALGDKFRPATSDMVIATKARDRYFDLDAVRTPLKVPEAAVDQGGRNYYGSAEKGAGNQTKSADGGIHRVIGSNPAGSPPLDTWVIPTHPYKGAHYATWPPDLCTKPIKSMVPERVCRTCGQPSRRLTETEYEKTQETNNPSARGETPGVNGTGADPSFAHGRSVKHVTTVGWSDCGHDDWRRGIVLDPFAGSGTTLAVATGHGRDAIGIDLDPRNADLARERIGMFLEVI